jgi:hypothetical protein
MAAVIDCVISLLGKPNAEYELPDNPKFARAGIAEQPVRGAVGSRAGPATSRLRHALATSSRVDEIVTSRSVLDGRELFHAVGGRQTLATTTNCACMLSMVKGAAHGQATSSFPSRHRASGTV